jgi:hypothetical protein
MEIQLNFDYVDKFGCPQIDVLIGDNLLYTGDVSKELNAHVELAPGQYQLKIVHKGKNVNDYDASADRHVFIKSIKFDGIDLDQIEHCPLTHRGKFYPEYEASYVQTSKDQGIVLPEYISPNHYLGHNGTWVLDFSYPVYDWIIVEQKPSGINLEDTIFSTGNDSLAAIKLFFNV